MRDRLTGFGQHHAAAIVHCCSRRWPSARTGAPSKSLTGSMLGLFAWLALTASAGAEGVIVEQVKTYAISGQSGLELYQSIGDKGPTIGLGTRTIAHTTFTLTWRRDYLPTGAKCVLASAVPRLVIVYTLPKAPSTLPASTAANWNRFLAGIEAHERVHGRHIRDMVAEIEAASVGLTVDNDPQCKAIRTELTRRLGEISNRRRAREQAFEQKEMAPGGPIQSLILALVNGG